MTVGLSRRSFDMSLHMMGHNLDILGRVDILVLEILYTKKRISVLSGSNNNDNNEMNHDHHRHHELLTAGM